MIELFDEPMCDHTTFRVGGKAKRFLVPESADDIIDAVKELEEKKEEYIVIGNGSNLLVSDEGFDGTVILISDKMNKITVEGNSIYAEAGAMLSAVARVAKENSLSGFEFASGIPGTVGGAIFMNAGAYDGEMKQVVNYVDVIENGILKKMTCDEMDFGYRHSIVMEKSMIVVGTCIDLVHGDEDAIKDKMKDLNKRRVEKQPLEYPSAGSTFKRPPGYFAGALIEEAGLKGFSLGGARVSEKHAGFVVQEGKATAAEVYALCRHVQKKVKENSGVELSLEVKTWGEF